MPLGPTWVNERNSCWDPCRYNRLVTTKGNSVKSKEGPMNYIMPFNALYQSWSPIHTQWWAVGWYLKTWILCLATRLICISVTRGCGDEPPTKSQKGLNEESPAALNTTHTAEKKRLWVYGPLARYVNLWVVHALGMPGTFSLPPRVSDPDMHHGTCVTHVPWYMPGSITSDFIWSRWRGKGSRHSRRMRIPQFYVSGKRSILSC